MTKVTILKRLDSILGPLAVYLVRLLTPAKRQSAQFGRVLIIRPGGIGDAVLLIPAILNLRRAYPAALISVLAEKRNGEIFSLCPAIDHLYLYDQPSGLLGAITAGYDAVVDTEQWHRFSAVVSRLTGAPVSVGFSSNERGTLFSSPVSYYHDRYEAASFRDLFVPLSVEPNPPSVPFLTIPSIASSNVAKLLENAGRQFVTLFPGASIPERRWGSKNFRELAVRLTASGVRIVVVGGKADIADGNEICRETGGLQLAGKTTLAETAAIVARSSLLVTGDSGILHVAVGLGIPTVSLFGPGIEEKWAPRGEIHLVVNRKLPCSPCTRFGTTPPCPCGGRCIQDISVQSVQEAVVGLLHRETTSPGCGTI